ncbi:hypothetical protein CVT24_009942 [Panaeolus cyanescens]|uniref:Uncharacterized protein n=1 Tax=Panaeolus cyanescens TaxID=181874 RepID=A0A409VXK6_9AGAR|nr:hypothetical protein CVT24_009942 [Panaeolus cyanescens]
MSLYSPLLKHKASALSSGINIVRNVLKQDAFKAAHPEGFTTKQLYQFAVKEPVPQGFQPYPLKPTKRPAPAKYAKPVPDSFPPHPEHPLRSIKFLKTEILPYFSGRHEIKMVKQPRTGLPLVDNAAAAGKKKATSTPTEFVWKLTDPSQIPRPPAPKVKEVVGREVGVGLDISHLNKRRQRARVEDITRSVNRMKEFRAQAQQSEAPAS